VVATDGETGGGGDRDADGSGSVLSFAAKADAYVRSGTNGDTNYGGDIHLSIKNTTVEFTRESFLMFDLSSVASVKSATLQLTHESWAESPLVGLFAASSDWTEYGVTWNTRPAKGALLAMKTVWGGVPAVESFDVTGFVQSELSAGRSIVSVNVSSLTYTGGQAFDFYSREAWTGVPMLMIVP
jgi:hypothetical protein